MNLEPFRKARLHFIHIIGKIEILKKVILFPKGTETRRDHQLEIKFINRTRLKSLEMSIFISTVQRIHSKRNKGIYCPPPQEQHA